MSNFFSRSPWSAMSANSKYLLSLSESPFCLSVVGIYDSGRGILDDGESRIDGCGCGAHRHCGFQCPVHLRMHARRLSTTSHLALRAAFALPNASTVPMPPWAPHGCRNPREECLTPDTNAVALLISSSPDLHRIERLDRVERV